MERYETSVRAKYDDDRSSTRSDADQNDSQNDSESSLIHSSSSLSLPPSLHHGSDSGEGRDDLNLPSAGRHEHWVIHILIVWGITLSVVVFIPMTNRLQADIIGTVVNLNLVVFYGGKCYCSNLIDNF